MEVGPNIQTFDCELYRKVEDKALLKVQQIVHTGTDLVLLPRSPQFLTGQEAAEPLQILRQKTLNEAIKRQVEKFVFSDSLINRIVYDSVDQSPFTAKANLGGFAVLPYYLPEREDRTLVFESRFESGNLRRAIQLNQHDYNLILKTDYNTNGHTQWFYFSLSNTRAGQLYRFFIVNMNKPDSLYNEGMRLLCYSRKGAEEKGRGWFRGGSDICYHANSFKKRNGTYFHTLTFAIQPEYDFDTIYLAHCYPYPYSQLRRFLTTIEQDPSKRTRMQRRVLCQSQAGNNCDYLTITEPNSAKQKKCVLLTSRVHPGESMSSYLIEYIIQFLLSSNPVARSLRQNLVFKIVPMLNVDGVINGNYRCGLSACDLNRQWAQPSKKLHPTIFYAKQLIKKSKQEREVLLYCDFHGHSRKKNIFLYGCAGRDSSRRQLQFPLLMRNNSNVFSFKDCSFAMQKDRQGAARIALWKQLFLQNCYTLEVSFCGADFGPRQSLHFNLEQYRQMAEDFCQSVLQLCEPEQHKLRSVSEEIDRMLVKVDRQEDPRLADSDSDFSADDPKDKEEELRTLGPEFERPVQGQVRKRPPSFLPKQKKGP